MPVERTGELTKPLSLGTWRCCGGCTAMSVAIGSAMAVVFADVASIGGSLVRPAPASAAVLASAGNDVVLVVVGPGTTR